jgi:hypothetical protein
MARQLVLPLLERFATHTNGVVITMQPTLAGGD